MLTVSFSVAEDGDHLLEGYLYKLGGTLMSNWPRKYFHLFPNRLEWRGEQAGVSYAYATPESVRNLGPPCAV